MNIDDLKLEIKKLKTEANYYKDYMLVCREINTMGINTEYRRMLALNVPLKFLIDWSLIGSYENVNVYGDEKFKEIEYFYNKEKRENKYEYCVYTISVLEDVFDKMGVSKETIPAYIEGKDNHYLCKDINGNDMILIIMDTSKDRIKRFCTVTKDEVKYCTVEIRNMNHNFITGPKKLKSSAASRLRDELNNLGLDKTTTINKELNDRIMTEYNKHTEAVAKKKEEERIKKEKEEKTTEKSLLGLKNIKVYGLGNADIERFGNFYGYRVHNYSFYHEYKNPIQNLIYQKKGLQIFTTLLDKVGNLDKPFKLQSIIIDRERYYKYVDKEYGDTLIKFEEGGIMDHCPSISLISEKAISHTYFIIKNHKLIIEPTIVYKKKKKDDFCIRSNELYLKSFGKDIEKTK